MNRQHKLKLLRNFRDYLMHDSVRSRICDRASEKLFLEISNTMKRVKSSISTEAVRVIFEAWTDTLPPGSRRSLTPKRASAIKRALTHYSLEDVTLAVQGWVYDPWEGRKNFNDLLHLLRDGGTVERFRDMNLAALKAMTQTAPQNEPAPSVMSDGDYNLDRSHRWSAKRGSYVPTDQWEPGK